MPSQMPLSMTHSVLGLVPALSVMSREGITAQQCLKGTGILLRHLDDHRQKVTLQQEIRFYRNLLELSGDTTVGLRVGAAYPPQRYGLLGYALLSAPTLRQVLVLASKFGDLSFTWFELSYLVTGEVTSFLMGDRLDIDADVANLLRDRDCAAAVVCFSEVLGQPLEVNKVTLPHDGHDRRADYGKFFNCPIEFNSAVTSIQFDTAVLNIPLPHRDAAASEQLHQQCQFLFSKLSRQSPLVDDVRQLLLSRPGFFPDCEMVAEKLGQSMRTLRRRLTEENTSYKEILDEVRFGLAKEYLTETSLPLQEISALLGYTEAGNFTHAFKRLAGVSPSEFRTSTKTEVMRGVT